jgi:hypothetical protein
VGRLCRLHQLGDVASGGGKNVRYQPENSFSLATPLPALTLTTLATRLSGIVEVDEVFVLESFKGRRHLDRPARHHGVKGKKHEHVPLVPVLIVLDRYGRESDAVLLHKSLN